MSYRESNKFTFRINLSRMKPKTSMLRFQRSLLWCSLTWNEKNKISCLNNKRTKSTLGPLLASVRGWYELESINGRVVSICWTIDDLFNWRIYLFEERKITMSLKISCFGKDDFSLQIYRHDFLTVNWDRWRSVIVF